MGKPFKVKRYSDEGACTFLVPALANAPVDQHPPRPFHHGGPPPKLDEDAVVALALWACDRADPYVAKSDRALFDAWVGDARRQYALGREKRSLGPIGPPTKKLDLALDVAARTLRHVSMWADGSRVAGWAGQAIICLVQLAYKRDGDVRALLVELDDTCVHLEACSKLRAHDLSTSAPLEHTQWRGSTKDKATHWLGVLENRSHALIHKIGGRWRLVEGAYDFVIAHLPDEHLGPAVAAVERDAAAPKPRRKRSSS